MFRYTKQPSDTLSRYQQSPRVVVRCSLYALAVLMLLLTACSPFDNTSDASSSDRVNGFGTKQNHTHSLVVLPDHVLLLASHFGLFRSTDTGQNWKMVAAGSGQEMDGMMTTSLFGSPLDTKRFYVLAQPTNMIPYNGKLGLYTSADEGQNWKLATSEEAVGAKKLGDLYSAYPGNTSANEVYVYLKNLGREGLKVSQDAGAHFASPGPMPFASMKALLAVPGKPGELLLGGDDGMARSTDAGKHWEAISNVKHAIYEFATSGPGGPIYASGDDGVFASQDGGKSFTLVYSEKSPGSLTVSPVDPKIVYGRIGTGILRSADGGHTWKTLPLVKTGAVLANVVADTTDPNLLYLSLSYPTALYRYDEQSGKWTSLTPAA